MAQQTVNIGSAANDINADQLRVAFNKLNQNFNETYALQSKTLNAADPRFAGASDEASINNAINMANIGAVATGAERVIVPASMLPYDASLVTFSTAVQMVREGGDWSVYDVKAYGAAGDFVQNDTAAVTAANQAAAMTTRPVYFPSATAQYRLQGTFTIAAPILWVGEGAGASTLVWIDNPNPAIILNNSPPPGGIPSQQRVGWGMAGLRLQPGTAQTGTAIQFGSSTTNLSIGVHLRDVDVVSWSIGHDYNSGGGNIATIVNSRILDCTTSIRATHATAGSERISYIGSVISQGIGAYLSNINITQQFTDFHFIGCSINNLQMVINVTGVQSLVTLNSCHLENPEAVNDAPCLTIAGSGADVGVNSTTFVQVFPNPTMAGFISQSGGRLTIDGGMCTQSGAGLLAAFINQTGGSLHVVSHPALRNTTAIATTNVTFGDNGVVAPHVDLTASNAALAAGNNNDYAGWNQRIGHARIAADAAGSTLTGIALQGGNLPGYRLTGMNISANTLTLSHQDVNSAATNRIITPTAANVAVAAGHCFDLVYDGVSARWRLIQAAP